MKNCFWWPYCKYPSLGHLKLASFTKELPKWNLCEIFAWKYTPFMSEGLNIMEIYRKIAVCSMDGQTSGIPLKSNMDTQNSPIWEEITFTKPVTFGIYMLHFRGEFQPHEQWNKLPWLFRVFWWILLPPLFENYNEPLQGSPEKTTRILSHRIHVTGIFTYMKTTEINLFHVGKIYQSHESYGNGTSPAVFVFSVAHMSFLCIKFSLTPGPWLCQWSY